MFSAYSKPHKQILPIFAALFCWFLILTLCGCESQPPTLQQNGQIETLEIEWSESSLCAIGFLGYTSMLPNNHSIEEVFESYADLYPKIKNDSSVKMIELSGDEVYFILARYAGTKIMVNEIDTTSVIMGGDVYTGSVFEDNFETALLLCNQSDLYSNCEITISANEKQVTFSPGINLNDGSISLPENGVQLLELDLLKQP